MYIPPDTPPGAGAPDSSNAYAFGDFTVDAATSKLLRGDLVVSLPSRAFDVLVYLIRHRERPVKKDEIIAAIWDNVIVTDDSLIHAISVLRRALGDEAHQHKYIETIPRRGYRFVGKVEVVERPRARVLPEPLPLVAPVAEVRSEAGIAVEPQAIADTRDSEHREPQGPARANPRAAWLVAAASLAALGVLAVLLLLDHPAERAAGSAPGASVRLFQPPPPGMQIVSGGMLSPDSRYLAFVARDNDSGQPGLWVRALQSGEPVLIKGSEGASKPFWAPDSSRIGFFAHGQLFTTDLNGAQIRRIADAGSAAGGTWGADGTILFADWTSGLYAVAASGDGQPAPVMLLERENRDIAFAWPQFLPDNRRFLFQIVSLDAARAGAYVGDLDTRQSFRILDTASPVTFAPPNYLLHVQRGMLIAEELDPRQLQLTGHAVVVARDIAEPELALENFVSASADLLAFKHGVKTQDLAWFNRAGAQLDSVATPAVLYNPRLSPDGAQLLASSSVTSNPGLWLTSLEREEFARIERDATAPVWSPDGTRIAFTSRDGEDLVIRSSDGAGTALRLMQDEQVKILNDWSPDGKYIVYTRLAERTGLDLWMVDVATGVARPLLESPSGETQARISPDGAWLAYTSDETGALETFVARFPGLGDKVKVSDEGGGQPQWRADQKELFYFSADQSIMALEVESTGGPLAFGAVRKLFRTRIPGSLADAREYYATDAAGAAFLMDTGAHTQDNQEISIMVNWAARLADPGPDLARGSWEP